MRTYSSFCGTVCSDSTGTVTSDAAVRLHRRYQLFGMTAKEWREQNPDLKGNLRDYASIHQLLVLANMESYNAILIKQGISQPERLLLLNKMAIEQIKVIENHHGRLLS